MSVVRVVHSGWCIIGSWLIAVQKRFSYFISYVYMFNARHYFRAVAKDVMFVVTTVAVIREWEAAHGPSVRLCM